QCAHRPLRADQNCWLSNVQCEIEEISRFFERSCTMPDDKSLDVGLLLRKPVKKRSQFAPFLEADRAAANVSKRHRKRIGKQPCLGKTLQNVFNRKFRSELRIVQHIQARRRDRGNSPTTTDDGDSRSTRHHPGLTQTSDRASAPVRGSPRPATEHSIESFPP